MVDEVLLDIIKRYQRTQSEKENPTEMQEFVFDVWFDKLIKKHGLYKVIRAYTIYILLINLKSHNNFDSVNMSVQHEGVCFFVYLFYGKYPQPVHGNIMEFSDKGRTLEEVSALVKLINDEINVGLKDV